MTGAALLVTESEAGVTLDVELPDDWSLATLGDLFEIQQGKALSADARKGTNLRPFLRTANVLWSRLNLTTVDRMHFTDEEAARLSLRPGDLLICEGGDVGRTALWRGEIDGCSYQNHIHRLRPSGNDVLPEFYMYWMRAALLRLGLYGGAENRTTIPNLSKGRLSRFVVPVPSVEEQRAIVAVLSALQRNSEATRRVAAATRVLKVALVRRLFTHGAVPNGEAPLESSGDTNRGTLPSRWDVLLFGELLREPLRNGHSARQASTADTGIRTLTLSAVTQNDFSVSNTKPTVASSEKVKDLWLEPGDILVERANTRELVGIAALYEGPRGFAIYPDLMIRARVREDVVDPKFVAEFLMSEGPREYFRRSAGGAAGNMPKIGHGVLERLAVPVPEQSEQKLIVEILRSADRKIAAETSRAAKLDLLFDSLLSGLMTGRRRVDKWVAT